MARRCKRCNKFLPHWDLHKKCAKHRKCSQAVPCRKCRSWDAAQWTRLAQWLEAHPGPMPRAQQVSLPQTQGLNKSGSLSDSVLLERPSPFQGSSSETGDYDVEVDLYASSSNPEDEGQEGHKGWLESQGSRQVHSAVGSAPRTDQALAAQGSHPVGPAPGAEPQSRSSLYPPQTPVGSAPGLGSGSVSVQHPLSPVGYAPGVDVRTQQHPVYPVGYAPGVDVRTQQHPLYPVGYAPGVDDRTQRPAQQDPSQAPVGYAPRAGSGSADVHHTLPPASSAPQADVSTDRPLQAMSQGLRTEAVPGVQGTGPGLFSGRSRARKLPGDFGYRAVGDFGYRAVGDFAYTTAGDFAYSTYSTVADFGNGWGFRQRDHRPLSGLPRYPASPYRRRRTRVP